MGSPVRILILSNLFPPDVLGGYELLVRDVSASLRARGHDVEVLTTGSPRADDPAWVSRRLSLVRPFEEPGRLDRARHLRAAFTHARVVARFLDERPRFDVALLGSLRRLGLHSARALTERGLRSVWLFNDDYLLAHRPNVGRNPLVSGLWSLLERGPLGARTWDGVHIDRAVYPTAAIREALRAGGARVPEGVVRFQGVNPETFVPRAPRAIGERPELLFVGRLHPTKGCELAIDALRLARRDGLDARLTIAGRGDAAYEESLRRHASSRGVSEHVQMLGFVGRDRLPALYARCDVFLFPSIWEEPAGLTYLEAMACGVPVVAYARGGAKELLVDRENARVVETPSDMARAVTELCHTPSLAQRLIDGGLRTVADHATLEGYVDAIESELRSAHQPQEHQVSA